MLGSIRYNLANILNFHGRDARPTFWYYVLFLFILQVAIGMVAAIPRSRSQARFAFDGYPLSASTRSGRVRGLPFPSRGTRMSSSTAVIIVVSLMFPPVIIIPSGRPRPSQTRCSLVVSPPRERPIP